MKYLLITTFIVLSGALFLPSAQAQNCRSEKRGYCVELASLAQAQMLEELFPTNSVREPGDIIPALYKFGLGLVGISALGALIVGGVYYMTAGGSQDRAKRGRTWLGNAVFGLVLALLSFLILNTINPDFLKRLSLNLTPINPAPPIQNSPSGVVGFIPYRAGGTQVENVEQVLGATGWEQECARRGGTYANATGTNICIYQGAAVKQKIESASEETTCQAANVGGQIIISNVGRFCTKPFKNLDANTPPPSTTLSSCNDTVIKIENVTSNPQCLCPSGPPIRSIDSSDPTIQLSRPPRWVCR